MSASYPFNRDQTSQVLLALPIDLEQAAGKTSEGKLC